MPRSNLYIASVGYYIIGHIPFCTVYKSILYKVHWAALRSIASVRMDVHSACIDIHWSLMSNNCSTWSLLYSTTLGDVMDIFQFHSLMSSSEQNAFLHGGRIDVSNWWWGYLNVLSDTTASPLSISGMVSYPMHVFFKLHNVKQKLVDR